MAKISSETSADVKVTTAVGDIQLDKQALKTITGDNTTGQIKLTAETVKVETLPEEIKAQVGEKALVVDLNVETAAGKVTSLNGGIATISVPMPAGVDVNDVAAIYVKTNGQVERVIGKVITVNGKQQYQFETGHFSYYAIVDKATADKAVAKTSEKFVNGVKGTKIVKAKALASKGKVTLTWAKTKGFKVDGYQVWKSQKKTRGFVKMITKTTKKYVNTKGLKSGKTYYYKVRGFRVIDGKTVYTPWTKVSVVAK